VDGRHPEELHVLAERRVVDGCSLQPCTNVRQVFRKVTVENLDG
jgi:hypothetical protein